ncbi:MAG: serine/threonine-protein kinase [Isosphaeraceae bacterium]|nr:serine/threonine-protein kinase [Isosphaeraceae bacterium]
MSDVTQIEAIYMAAAERTDPAERAAYLDAACGTDVDLRRRVDELLVAHPKLGRFLDPPSGATGAYVGTGDGVPLAVGQLIDGRYKLLERIGEGGMGEVWVADQLAPVRRRVAVKLIKPGMDSRGVPARFDAERQALALMDHPNIAKVLDAGSTAAGRPYFVMELVKGTPITEFADARRLTPTERLALFVPVCQAIHHAHQKGVIHRDIKPSNVLVELHDDRLVPKVIDFGVAKAVGGALTEKTIYTGLGTLVGTPAYMAPEQATFNALDIDTRADVYALGVLLYELLAGSPPVEAERMKKAALDEVLRLIREEEPPRPSQRLNTSQTKASIAAVRGSDPVKLSALMRGELDWIVMKALEKDRSRRYDTATALAKDVQRYIDGDSVEACPPTLGYRLRKAYRRNRAAVWVACGFIGMALSAAAAGTMLAIQAKRAEALAEKKRVEADEQRQEAEDNKNAWLEMSDVYMKAAAEAEIRNASARIDADLLEYKSDSRVGLLRLARPLKDYVGPLPLNGPNSKGSFTETFESDPEFVKLREFQAAAAISAGQEFVPLVQPLNTNNVERIAPDGRLCIAGTEREGLRLIAIPSLEQVGLLREANERLLQWGFSPEGNTAYTQDTDGVARFWNRDGTLRAKTPVRPDRCVYPAGLSMKQLRRSLLPWDDANELLVTDGTTLVRSITADWAWQKNDNGEIDKAGDGENFRMGPMNQRGGPHDLYDSRTGKFIRRLTPPGRTFIRFELSPDMRWILGIEDACDAQGRWQSGERGAQLVILSAADGRELARLDLAVSDNSPSEERHFSVSPSGRWVAAYQRHNAEPAGQWVIDAKTVRLWRTTDWQPVADATLVDALAKVPDAMHLRFVTDDWLAVQSRPGNPDEHFAGWLRLGQPGSWRPSQNDILAWGLPTIERLPSGETLFRWFDDLFTSDTIERLEPPSGRRYHPALAKLAPDGRFWTTARVRFEQGKSFSDDFFRWYSFGHRFGSVEWYGQKQFFDGQFLRGDRLGHDLDTATEKDFPYAVNGPYIPEFGRVAIRTYGEGGEENPRFFDDGELRILPDPKRLAIPPEMLELWAQLVTGGELGSDGRFQPWDEPTWLEKQRELAAMKPPYADFPFPGWAATEPHLWYRIQSNMIEHGSQREKLREEWRRRSGRVRPKPEPDSWRTPGPATEPAPPPRAVK